MKKSIILCIIVLFMTSAVLTAQVSEQLWQWAEQAGGSSSDVGYSISVDADGNSYVTGYFKEVATFGTTTLTSSGSYDVFVAKFDVAGNWLWAKRAGGTNSDQGKSISIDANGNSYITGYFFEVATFGTTTLTSAGIHDVFVAKLDTDGNWLWAKSAGGSDYDQPNGITADANGNAYITGSYIGTVTFGAYTLTGDEEECFDAFIAKLDSDGNWQWAKKASGNDNDLGYGIGVDADANVYVTGIFLQTALFGPFTLIGNDTNEIFVAKLDTDGNWQWAKQANGSSYDNALGISVDSNGNSYITGDFQGTATFGDFTLTSSGSGDILVAKLDTDGNWQWAEQAGGNSSQDISIDSNGNSYITGYFEGTATFDTTTLTSSGSFDVFVAKLDADGNWQWAQQAGGSGSDWGYGISADSNGNSYVTGDFQGTATFGTFTLTSSGSYDVYVVKLIELIGDFNDDGYVDATDLQMLVDHWHLIDTDPGWDALYNIDDTPDPATALQIIDAADLQVFADDWHKGIPPTLVKGDGGKGSNAGAGIVFDLDATTTGNQNLTHIDSQPAGTYIRVDVYATGVHNLDTYEFEVVYDPDGLEYITCSATNPLTFEGNILESEGGTAVGWMVDTDTPGILSIAYSLTGTDTLQAPEGEGLVADIVFQAKVATYGTLNFGDVYYYDTEGVSDEITDTGTATLPVELSAFTATYEHTNGYTSIKWTTASETDIIGFNVYRSTEDYFDTAEQLNQSTIDGHGTTTEMNSYEFIDNTELDLGTIYYYWLESVEYSGINTVYSSINITPEEGTGGYEESFTENMLMNHPNPVKGTTTISYGIKGMLEAEPVEIKIYNMLGQLVDTVEGRNGTAIWNTSRHSTGIYFYKLDTDSYTEIKKMMVTK